LGARNLNLLGKHILGSDFSFYINLFQESGAFVCGEETALIASLEGKPGIPQHRPPYPAVNRLHGKPTLINNVKTIAYVRHIIEYRAEWFAGIGTEKRGNCHLFLAGKVVNTGLRKS
jgi:NADH-quinone oxidoreductase subunit F